MVVSLLLALRLFAKHNPFKRRPCSNALRVLLVVADQAILELHWSPNSPTIITCSADKTLGYWDANAGKRKKTFKAS